jgi:hypothetical protein
MGFCRDSRLASIIVRRAKSSSAIARLLNIPVLMDWHYETEPQSGSEIAAIKWQESGTGDVYLSMAILFGTVVGNNFGAAGSLTDQAGCLLVSPGLD